MHSAEAEAALHISWFGLGVTVVLNKMMSLCVQERPWCRREYTYVALKRWHKWAGLIIFMLRLDMNIQ